ncbi:MAG: periplasmic heavy metal sensor [Pseudomonadota bacterium]
MLGVSLALNFSIIGLIVGASMRFGGPNPGPATISYAVPYVAALPRDERRQIFRRAREQSGFKALPDRAARRDLYRQVLEALRADPFDAAVVEAVLAKQTSSMLSVQQAAQQAWLQRIGSFSAEERVQYADRLEEILKKGPRRHGKD